MNNVEQLLKSLMDIPSLEKGEHELGYYLYNFLHHEGFTVEKHAVDKDRYNLIAKIGNPKVYLQAHMDTVPPVIPFSEDDTYIYGRGACDTKGSMAAMILAAVACKKQAISDFGLILTTGEETDLDGAKKLVEEGFDAPFIIVGEPTSLEIVYAHFGLINFKLIAHGKAVHSSIPEQGVNAIDLLLPMIEKIKTMEVHPQTSLTLVQMHGGIAENIVPAEAYAMFSMRTSPEDKTDYIEQVQSLLMPNITLETLHDFKSVNADIPKELNFISDSKTVKYFTELSLFQKGIVLGPGDIADAHGPHEKVPKTELTKAVEIYSQIIHNFCKK